MIIKDSQNGKKAPTNGQEKNEEEIWDISDYLSANKQGNLGNTEEISPINYEMNGHTGSPQNLNFALDETNKMPFWQKLSLKTKATTLAIAIGIVPVITIGAIAYYFSNQSISNEIFTSRKVKVNEIADKVSRFMFERYGDVSVLAKLPILSNLNVIKITSAETKKDFLTTYLNSYLVYDSIAVFDLNGNLIQEVHKNDNQTNTTIDKQLFEKAITTGKAVIGDPKVSKNQGKLDEKEAKKLAESIKIELVGPIKELGTGKIIGVVRTVVAAQVLEQLIQDLAAQNGEEYHLSNSENILFVSKDKNEIGLNYQEHIQSEAKDYNDQKGELLIAANLPKLEGMPELKWSAVYNSSPELTFGTQRQLLLTLMVGTGVTALIVSAIAVYLANKITKPIIFASKAVKELGEGALDTRIEVLGGDEVAILGSNINLMAEQLQTFIQQREEAADQAQILANITLKLRESLNIKDILYSTVNELKSILPSDRVAVLRFDSQWKTRVIAEAVNPGFVKTLGVEFADTCLIEGHGGRYKQGEVRAIADIYEAGLTDCHIKLLEKFQVRANLVLPILLDNQLFGLLIIHNCTNSYEWQEAQIQLCEQVAAQVGIALSQTKLLKQLEIERKKAELTAEEQKEQRVSIQMQILTLLEEVEGAARGDLTVRADVTATEIGTVADFFNAIVESLRQVVTQVKQAATQVNYSLGENETAISQLAEASLKQVEEITNTLDSVEKMTNSIQEVAVSARKAADIARGASQTAQTSGEAMDRTVQSILTLRETVAETAKKVKRLGESSQQISKVISLINQIALQTNLLAINASIEAARAGEEGRGFAVVAEEVGELAAKSAAATKEIEQIVENIQQETIEVAQAMEIGTSQVVEGTELVAAAKNSLAKIVEVSKQIDELVQSISTATVSQAETSTNITKLMKEIANISQQTSSSSRQVSTSLQSTVEVAKELQASVGTFKIIEEE
jgi:methyl-accepting chemotaxis protein PixJ